MDDIRQKLARMLLGKGQAGQAADLQAMYPIYQQQRARAQMEGMDFPQFPDWQREYMTQQQAQAPGTVGQMMRPQMKQY